MTLYGRRRVGKSWLFRAFAHGRDADIFVASTRALADQLAGFAESLERDGERPALPDLEAFFRLLYRRARDSRRLVVIDELPYLWTAERELPSILLKVMEEEALVVAPQAPRRGQPRRHDGAPARRAGGPPRQASAAPHPLLSTSGAPGRSSGTATPSSS